MKDIWVRLHAWCATYAPEILESLNPGATDAEIQEAEAFLGVTFPDDVRELYAIHDGQKGYDADGLLDGGEFLSLRRVREEWAVWKELLDSGTFNGITSEPTPGVRDDWWNPAWIPITYDGAGNHWCVDLAPGEGGRAGQIIRMLHDEGERRVAAPSITEWLRDLADGLESGELVYSPEEYGGVVPIDDVSDDEEWRGVARNPAE